MPVTLQMYGGGGKPRLKLENMSQGNTFDFGRCMIGRSITKHISIHNSGNAVLSILYFELQEDKIFMHGENWPSQRVDIKPNSTYHLPVRFCAPGEEPCKTSLTVRTRTAMHRIQVVGTGALRDS